jgi:hypothetical protein
LYRGLDSHGFTDLKAAVMTYASYISLYPDKNEPRHLNLGTPAEMFRSIERAWTVAPTSKRICEDILMLPFVLDKVIAAQGTTVEGEVLRHGRRKAKHRTWESVHQRVAPLVNKPRSFKRIETLAFSVPMHPDVERASGSREGRGGFCFSSCYVQSVFGCPAAREFNPSSIKQLKFREISFYFSKDRPIKP